MLDFFENLEVKSVPQQIAEEIEKEIVKGNLKTGDKLPSLTSIADKLGVSKPTVQEGLKELIDLELVYVTKGRNGGYFVTNSYEEKLTSRMFEMINLSLTFKTMDRNDLLEVRKMIEVESAALAAERRNERNVEEFRKIIHIMNNFEVYSTEELLNTDLHFHLTVAECTHNPLIKTIINAVTKSYMNREDWWIQDKTPLILDNVEKVIYAIRDKDAHTAKIEMEKHMNNFFY